MRIVAPNPGPMTLEGTNTYLVGSGPAWVIDPGPAIPSHVEAIRAAAAERGGIGGVVLTHSHADHSEAVPLLDASLRYGIVSEGDEAAPATSSAAPAVLDNPARSRVKQNSPGGEGRIGPFTVLPSPGHAADHVCFIRGEVCFCGDLVLGAGSSIVPPAAAGGSLADYMASLERVRALEPRLLCPGHGPWITDPDAKLAEYVSHRREREAKLVAALEGGERSRERLLDAAWDDVPEPMRPAAAMAMQAHLEKLADGGVLPDGIHLESGGVLPEGIEP